MHEQIAGDHPLGWRALRGPAVHERRRGRGVQVREPGDGRRPPKGRPRSGCATR